MEAIFVGLMLSMPYVWGKGVSSSSEKENGRSIKLRFFIGTNEWCSFSRPKKSQRLRRREVVFRDRNSE